MVADPSEALQLSSESVHAPTIGPSSNGSLPEPSRILLVGWNPMAPRVLRELDKWVTPESLVRVLVDETIVDPDDVAVPGTSNITLAVSTAESSSPQTLLELIADREKIFSDLFEVAGSEVCMRPVTGYADPEPGVPYASYVAAAHRAGHLAIGYRTTKLDGHRTSYGVVLNPAQTDPVDLQPDDRIIVVARR